MPVPLPLPLPFPSPLPLLLLPPSPVPACRDPLLLSAVACAHYCGGAATPTATGPSTTNSLSLKHLSPDTFGSSRLLPQKPYVLLRACLALNSLYWLIRSMSVFGNAHWLVSRASGVGSGIRDHPQTKKCSAAGSAFASRAGVGCDFGLTGNSSTARVLVASFGRRYILHVCLYGCIFI